MRVCQNVHILFLCTKPRLSQARALLFPKVFVPLGIQKSHYDKGTLSFLHTQENDSFPQRIDKDIAEDDLFVFRCLGG